MSVLEVRMANNTSIGVIAGISGEVITKELQKLGKKAVLICGKENESGADIADDVLVADLKEKEKIARYLSNAGVCNILLGTGHILAFELGQYLHEQGFKLSVDIEASLRAKDKIAYKEDLQKQGFDTPAYHILPEEGTYDAEQIIKKVGLPCVVKSSIDKLYPQLVDKKEGLIKAVEEVRAKDSPILLEEYICGIDCTVPVLCNKKECKAVLVSYYSKAKECKLKGFKEFSQDKLDEAGEEKILRLAEEAMKATGIIGLARADIMIDNSGKPYILETNSVIVTGVHPQQIEYGIHFLQKENVNFAEMLVKNALDVFSQQ